MLQSGGDLGASLYKTWSKGQKREEIARLVAGLHNGLPLGVVCNMVTLIAGSKKQARQHFRELMNEQERAAAVARETGAMRQVAEEYLLS